MSHKRSPRHTMRTILLVGRSGNGTTSCVQSINRAALHGNSILTDIKAVECSGVCDTGSDRVESVETVTNKVREELKRHDVQAVCFVLKYGVRFTKQEKDAVQEVRSMFGLNVFREHGIIIMTYGDLFEADSGEEGLSFMDWCREQSGDIQSLFEELSYRVVLFNKRAQDASKLQQQLEDLQRCLSQITRPYNFSDFNQALRERAQNERIALFKPRPRRDSDQDMLVPVRNRNTVYAFVCRFKWLIICVFIITVLALFLLIYFLK
ncbi:uncharacterized protein LOC106068188 [Biomphalaria glabrata]|uniref:Uncharacterized protein LOC106068188 n=1 Tax=Biomphalaria glabrata TaxID=6526 RepID=A0A9U8EDE6_BIOGL|nr:uncharacterized protein LOC106068188 [Biomphalaria glabrata]